MPYLVRLPVVVTTATVMLTALLAACATQKPRNTDRLIGFKETVILDAKQLRSASELTEYSRVIAEASLQTAPGYRNGFATTVHAPNGRTLILRRRFTSGSFGTNFGQHTRAIFSIQPCSDINISQYVISCQDTHPISAMTVEVPLMVAKGEIAVAKFPNGVEWTYQVLDQSQPY